MPDGLAVRTDTPRSRLLRSLRCGPSYAPSARVRHLRSGPSTDGVCGCASSLLRWYRARPPSSTRSCATASTMLTACPATPVSSPGTLADSATLGTPLHSLCAPLLSPLARGYRRCSPWHTLAHGYAVLRSRKSPPIDSARAQNRRKIEISPQFCRIIFYTSVEHENSRPKCAHETESAFRFIGHTLAILPPIRWGYPAYSAKSKSGLRFALRRAVGGSCQTDQRENFPFETLRGCKTAF